VDGFSVFGAHPVNRKTSSPARTARTGSVSGIGFRSRFQQSAETVAANQKKHRQHRNPPWKDSNRVRAEPVKPTHHTYPVCELVAQL
jgi:hypothetical protein